MATSSWGLPSTLEFVRVICLYSNLYTYKASECKHANIRLACDTSKSSLWNMGYVARGGAFESIIYTVRVLLIPSFFSPFSSRLRSQWQLLYLRVKLDKSHPPPPTPPNPLLTPPSPLSPPHPMGGVPRENPGGPSPRLTGSLRS